MHYSSIVVVATLAVTSVSAFPLVGRTPSNVDVNARSIDKLVHRDPALGFKDDKNYLRQSLFPRISLDEYCSQNPQKCLSAKTLGELLGGLMKGNPVAGAGADGGW